MPFDYDDPYTTIDCKILAVRLKAIQIEDEHGAICWCPRSVLHGGDDRLVEGSVGDDVVIRMRAWFADKEGLT